MGHVKYTSLFVIVLFVMRTRVPCGACAGAAKSCAGATHKPCSEPVLELYSQRGEGKVIPGRRRMATPGAMRGLRALSLCATGAAVLYVLSDGGDVAVLEQRAEAARARAETLPAELKAAYERVVAMIPVPSPAAASVTENSEKSSNTEAEAVQRPQAQATQQATERPETPFCHTCTGPRIWYLADKFRFKRRISPHPDPSSQDEEIDRVAVAEMHFSNASAVGK